MPTYHYSCERCGHEFDCLQRITDKPRKRCPRCHGSVYRVIHPVGHILKGSGFYSTDNRKDDFKKKEKEEKAASSGTPEKSAPPKKKEMAAD